MDTMPEITGMAGIFQAPWTPRDTNLPVSETGRFGQWEE